MSSALQWIARRIVRSGGGPGLGFEWMSNEAVDAWLAEHRLAGD